MSESGVADLRDRLGPIDVYLFDQLLRRRIRPGMRVLDVGCGGGRNLVHLLREGYKVYGLDTDAESVAAVRQLAGELAPNLDAERHFRHEAVEEASFTDGLAEVVVASAVFHFARDREHFRAMVGGAWRLLAPGGLFFSRLASSTGIEDEVREVEPAGERRFLLPDGSRRFLVDEAMLEGLEAELGARRADPLKTTLVHHQRSMTTWVLRKQG